LAALGALAGLMRFGAATDARVLSLRRGVVLCLLALFGVTATGLVTRELQQGLGVLQAVMITSLAETAPARAGAAERYLEQHGLARGGAGAIAATSDRIARALYVGTIGGGLTLGLMLAFTLIGLVLAWRVRTDALFAAVSSTLWLAVAVAGMLLALGLGAPPSF